jgi:spermidine/putrescine transport system substrate-binding protein
MKKFIKFLGASAITLSLGMTSALAAEELFIYNWTDYTSPDLIKKFEKETGISVTLDTFDSNETLLAKLKSGATGYDIVVPSHNFVEIFIKEGLLQEINASKLAGYENIADDFKNSFWDTGNKYTIPWMQGATSFTIDTDVYKGDIHTFDILLNPPKELQGKVGMFKSASDVISIAQIALGIPFCSEDPAEMTKVLELLKQQKTHVKIYSSDGILERLTSGDVAVHQNWSGYSIRAREKKASLAYSFPKEGVPSFADNIAVPKGAKNYDNAIKFIEFMMQPENAALQSNFAGYANGIKGSDKFFNDAMKNSPEVNPPAGTKFKFVEACSEKAIKLETKVWETLLQ